VRDTIDVVAVNAKGGQAEGGPLARWVRRVKSIFRPLVVLISEADGPNGPQQNRIAEALTARMPRAELYRGTKDHGAREVAVLVLGRRLHVHGWESTQLTQGHGWTGGGQDRWAMVVRATFKGRKVAFVSTHASTTQPDTIAPELAKIVATLRGQGYVVAGLGGDLNQADGRRSSWRKFAHRAGFTAHATRVMWVMVDHALEVASTKVLPLSAAISDHPAALRVRVRVPRLRGKHR
jgi:hypothetical protein